MEDIYTSGVCIEKRDIQKSGEKSDELDDKTKARTRQGSYLLLGQK